MKWCVIISVALFVCIGGYSWIAVLKYRILPLRFGTIPPDYVEFRGAVHIHTNASEGAGSPEVILEAAGQAGLDFIAITDHNTMASWEKEQMEATSSPVLLKGIEISTNAGHLLGLGLEKVKSNFPRDAQAAINEVRALGGYPVLSHPTRPKTPWRNPSVDGFAGMEILNMNNAFGRLSFLKRLLLFPQAWINENGTFTSLIEFDNDAMSAWDTLNNRRIVFGSYGADAHGPVFSGVPSYESVFRVASLHLVARKSTVDTLTENDVKKLLGDGSFYISLDGLSLSTYVDLRAVRDGSESKGIGETCEHIRRHDRLRFDALTPEGALIKLMRNGTLYAMFESPHFEIPLKLPGAYRIEIVIPKEHNPYGMDKTWIVTNHLYVL